MAEDEAPVRVGSSVDLARRMDKIEARHETLETEVRNLTVTVGRVETNQAHAEELNKLRFDSQKTSLDTLGAKLDQFIARIDGIISGEVQTAQTRQGQELLAEWTEWRKETSEKLSQHDEFQTQGKLLGRIVAFIGIGNVIAIVAALAAAAK